MKEKYLMSNGIQSLRYFPLAERLLLNSSTAYFSTAQMVSTQP